MRLIVAGSRTFNNYELLRNEIVKNFPTQYEDGSLEIVSGMARGADSQAVDFAFVHMLTLHEYPAEWDKYGKSAGYRRNEDMAKNADALIAFWDGVSKGTKHMIDLAHKYKLRVVVVKF